MWWDEWQDDAWIFLFLHEHAPKVMGNEFGKSYDEFVKVKWPLCQNWHAIRESCSPCLGECPHICGTKYGCVFVMQNAVLVILDTLCKIDPMLMKSRGKHDWYTQMWCGRCAWQVDMLKCHFLYGGHLHACKWPHGHMSLLTLPTCCPYWGVPLVKFLC